MIGLFANPIIYGILTSKFPDLHFLYSMSYSLIAVLVIMTVYGLVWKQERIVFATNTTMDLTSSKSALIWGLVVCAMTIALYVIFW